MQTPAKLTVGIFVAAGVFLAGYVANRPQVPVASASSTSTPRVLYYNCPMHPQYKSDHAGDCPSCGMRLVSVPAGSGENATLLPDIPGAVRVDAAKQQLIGVRTDEVHQATASHLLRAPGRVAVDDGRQYRLIAGADGWIRELGQNSAGVFVKKNQVLASYYTPNLVAATQTFVFALQTNAQSQSGDATIGYQRGSTVLSLQVALDSLRSLGMSEFQVDEIRRTRIAPAEVRLYSPIDGFVIARNISPQQRFDKGTEMYRIADIGHIWVQTDIFEKDREFVKSGAIATVRYRGREFPARMTDVLPQFDPQSRTLKTRFELDNPGYILRPDMFVDIEIHVNMPSAITVPADAVIDSGLRKTVYVDRGSGFFEPRLVKTGWRLGDRVQVTEGLEPGEHIVVSSNFLIDSESRMKLAAASVPAVPPDPAAEKDPVCGMDADPKAPNAVTTQHGGKTYVFCSEKCRKDFVAAPEKYVPKKQPAPGSGARGTE
jgi:membrane fusion protein, copper/silver efflux system